MDEGANVSMIGEGVPLGHRVNRVAGTVQGSFRGLKATTSYVVLAV